MWFCTFFPAGLSLPDKLLLLLGGSVRRNGSDVSIPNWPGRPCVTPRAPAAAAPAAPAVDRPIALPATQPGIGGPPMAGNSQGGGMLPTTSGVRRSP